MKSAILILTLALAGCGASPVVKAIALSVVVTEIEMRGGVDNLSPRTAAYLSILCADPAALDTINPDEDNLAIIQGACLALSR
jgi:hypothetical protein